MLTASHIANVPATAADRSMRPINGRGCLRACGVGASDGFGRSKTLGSNKLCYQSDSSLLKPE